VKQALGRTKMRIQMEIFDAILGWQLWFYLSESSCEKALNGSGVSKSVFSNLLDYYYKLAAPADAVAAVADGMVDGMVGGE
jgi:hypothetical protein